MSESSSLTYCDAIRDGFVYLLDNHPEVFVIGQGLWSPWYVGNTMTDLDEIYGRDRIMDSPVSEQACTAAAVGASLCGYRPIVVHPRMDFMLLATDAIVNQAAKWNHMLGGQSSPKVTIRSIINRGGEQGAQHSQALHGWYAHIPGLRVVMPATANDARDLLISSVLDDSPVIYIDDRWLYEDEEEVGKIDIQPIAEIKAAIRREGSDITLVAAGYPVRQCLNAAADLEASGISCEVIDLRAVNPLDHESVARSVEKTGSLMAIDGGWSSCGLAGEIIAGATERLSPGAFRKSPVRLTLPPAPAPTSKPLEASYYFNANDISCRVQQLFE